MILSLCIFLSAGDIIYRFLYMRVCHYESIMRPMYSPVYYCINLHNVYAYLKCIC